VIGVPVRSAKALANWALYDAGATPEPKIPIERLLRHFGIRRIIEQPRMSKAGRLGIQCGEVAVFVRASASSVFRFTLAHELGHYLLFSEEGVPLRDQVQNISWERYCNAFASQLLVPRPWLRGTYELHRPSLLVALEVAREAECSAAVAVAALNDTLGWNVALMVWSCHGDQSEWYAPTCILPDRARRHIEPLPATCEILASVRKFSFAELPLLVDGCPVKWRCELHRDGNQVLTLAVEQPQARVDTDYEQLRLC
jgi:IrrE N-terminal-like domain